MERQVKKLRDRTGNQLLHHAYSTKQPTKKKFVTAITRPIKMLVKSPVVLATSIYVGLVYGYTYLLFTSFGTLFPQVYGFSQSSTGLAYLGFGIGCSIALLSFGAVSDRLTAHLSLAGEWKPEHRLPPLIPGSLIIPIGLFWYGWSAQAKIHWIMPIIGSGWVAFGTLAVFTPIQTYLIDAFPLHAASAAAANTVFRSLTGAFLPLAGPKMYESLGQGWGNSLLAFIALAFTPIVWILIRYGERIRIACPVD